jgi:hypothetical protein
MVDSYFLSKFNDKVISLWVEDRNTKTFVFCHLIPQKCLILLIPFSYAEGSACTEVINRQCILVITKIEKNEIRT